MNCDLLIRQSLVTTSTICERNDVAVADGKIIGLAPQLELTAQEIIEADGLHLFSGLIDSHLHFNEPGRETWEGISTGSQALAAGGGTLYFDMPLNSHPPVLDKTTLLAKANLAAQKSFTDYAFWGGLVPQNLDHLEELACEGVIGFKAFMSNSGIDEFPCVDKNSLKKGMTLAAQLKKIVAVHAESESITSKLTQEKLEKNQLSVRDYLNSRPISSELEAIQQAIDLAGETGCALHIVHVSCGSGIEKIIQAKQKGVNVTCETCPHYLVLTEEALEQVGSLAKCAPPLRSLAEQNKLWNHLAQNQIDTIGSDHSPTPPEMKKKPNFFEVWGGISGVQHTFALLAEEGIIKRHLLPQQLSRLLSFNVAQRFNLPSQKGEIKIGADADFFLADLNQTEIVTKEKLFYRHRQTPYLGRELHGKVLRTFLRGQTLFRDGKIIGNPLGQWIKPCESL